MPRAQQVIDTSITGFSVDMLKDFITGWPLAHSDAWRVRSPGTTIAQTVSNGIPTFTIGGWYDVMGKGPTMNYVGQQNASIGRDTRLAMVRGQHADPRFQLLMGPYTHAGVDVALADQIRLRWFDRWLKDIPNGIDRVDSTLHFNLLGTNRWVDSKSWPVPETRSHVYYLDSGPSGTHARSINDGRLSEQVPENPGAGHVAWKVFRIRAPCAPRSRPPVCWILSV
ncbi:CocE/NonD family hydrolase [Nocardia nova]|nr:CocE/NonD family hydrolase [Nocardia nova]